MSDLSDERTDASRRYRYALSLEDQASHPYYAALSLACSTNELMIDLLVSVPIEQRNAMLIFAALHFQALSGHRELTELYCALTARERLSPQQFAKAVIAVVETNASVVSTQLHRSTQTNEPGRSAVFQAVLRELYRRGIDEVNLIDIGTSAGLNLYLDRYDIQRSDAPPSGDPLSFSYESLSAGDVPGPLPVVRSRIGVDLNPLDLANEDHARWLRACLWPEDPLRLARLEAIETVLAQWPAVSLIQAGALEGLDAALERVDPNASTVVMHSWAAAYFSAEVQVNFAARMGELVGSSRASWVYLEWPRAVAGLAPPRAPSAPPRPGASQIVVALAGSQPESWGWCHPHGRWLSLSPTAGPNA